MKTMRFYTLLALLLMAGRAHLLEVELIGE
jgi:hypothetical protein